MAGKARLEYKRAMMQRKQQMGQELGQEIQEKMKSAMSEFKRCLEEFALKHREEIRHDPEFRAHFHDMCQHAGVDPLASNKSSVNSFLSFSGWSFTTFYYELSVSVVEVCMSARAQNGGLIELNKLTSLVQQRRGSAVDLVSADDVLQAVGKLQALDTSFSVIPDPTKVKTKKGVTFYVNSVPRELDMNLHDVLGLARDAGWITLEQLAAKPSWTHRRAELVLESMIKDGTCLIDDGAADGIRLFWFPSSANGIDL